MFRVQFCGLSRADAAIFKAGKREIVFPRVLGREIFGRRSGDGASAVVWPARTCGQCEYCRTGRENLCQTMTSLGVHKDGGLQELMTVPAVSTIVAPAGLAGHLACLTEPAACALNGLEQLQLQQGQKLLVYGGGPMGMMLAIAAAAAGIKVSIVEPGADRLKRTEPLRKAIAADGSASPPSGMFHAAVNAAPAVEIVSDTLTHLLPGGKFCFFSELPSLDAIPALLLNEIQYLQLQIVGSTGCTRKQMTTAMQLIASRPADFEMLIDGVIELKDAPAALEKVASGQAMKFVVKIAD